METNKVNISKQDVGLGLRREFFDELKSVEEPPLEFLEIAPENWINLGGRRQTYLAHYAERFPLVCHGLSLSIGGVAPLDEDYLVELKNFLNQYQVAIYSEHLSFCSDEQGMLYDLIPIPFTSDAVHHVASRIKRVQDILERRIALENISYYYPLATELAEVDFINAVVSEADCDLLLDVNNVYVNSKNHDYDPAEFISKMPQERVVYLHMAGHYQYDENLLIDTHGEAVIDPVWELLKHTYQVMGSKPTLLERDNDIPALEELFAELKEIKKLQGASQ